MNEYNSIYGSLSDKTKSSINEVAQDQRVLHNTLCQIHDLLDGKISEEDYLKHFYGQYRPSKCKFLRGI